jgi:hypothetical protein
MDMKKENKLYQNYTKHSIDNTIVELLQSRDKSRFGSADKIFFFKELAYMLK